jgi:hypothetical protein
MSYHGGSEAWCLFEVNGHAYWIPGHRSVIDVVLQLHGW